MDSEFLPMLSLSSCIVSGSAIEAQRYVAYNMSSLTFSISASLWSFSCTKVLDRREIVLLLYGPWS